MTAPKPNILFILADDLGYADVSCYGRRDFSTPSIDRIAAEGMRFTRLTRIPRFAIRTDRQMAFGHIARFRPAAERLRRFLWLPQRRGRLLHAQIRAAWKYLKILDNTFLFDVAQDPMERANLKERRKDVYDRLVAQWNEWNSGMLPLDPQSFTGGFTGAQLADHFGAKAND
jgi:hypothetical protein